MRFTYQCVDSKTGDVVWTRKQKLGDPIRLDDQPELELVQWTERPPVAIYVSDAGTTTIRTSGDKLVFVSLEGDEPGKVALLEDALTEDELETYVRFSSAGPRWTGNSIWYYLKVADNELFVVRPWWGRRIFVSTSKGHLVESDDELVNAAIRIENQLVLQALNSDDEEWFEIPKLTAVYLAGVLELRGAIPLLRHVEKSAKLGGCGAGGPSSGEELQDAVDPHFHCWFDLRQAAQLSLRRLGENPAPLPCYEFQLEHGDKSVPFVPPRQEQPRHQNAQKIKVGMPAKQVLILIGSPDFVEYDTWNYDMDAAEPFSLTLTFDARQVTKINRTDPLWKTGLVRDEALAY